MDDHKYWQQLAQTFELAINEQKRSIDDLDAAIGDQQSIIGEQATEIQRLRRMVAKGGKVAERLQDIFGGAE